MTFALLARAAMKWIGEHWQLVAALAVVAMLAISMNGWAHARERAKTAEHALDAQVKITNSWRTVARHQSDKAIEAARLRAEFEALLAAELAKPPKVVVHYKDAQPGVPVVVSEASDCEEGVANLARYLQEVIGGAP